MRKPRSWSIGIKKFHRSTIYTHPNVYKYIKTASSLMFLQYLLVILAFTEDTNCFRNSRTKKINNARIFNGQTASKNQFPWHVFLEITFKDKRSKTGGGVLISKKHILTCAHVFYHS